MKTKTLSSMVFLCGVLIPGLLPAAESEPLCEFDHPEITADYWPVFPVDPEKGDGTVPVVDIFLNEKGKATRHAVLNEKDELIRAITEETVQVMNFQPAIACGEYVEGFYRHAIQSYFYVEKEDLPELTTLPASAFFISREVQASLAITSKASDLDVLQFSLKVTPEGKVENLIGLNSEWARQLGSGIMKQIAKSFVFKPARVGEKAVKVGLILEIHLRDTLDGEIFDTETVKVRKPMPVKPDSEDLDLGKVHSVELSFYENGQMEDIQFLTPMTEAESLAALQAFRNWRIEPPKDLYNTADFVRRLQFGFTAEDERAVLIDEKKGPAIILPVFTKRKIPVYPRDLLRNGVSGVVRLVLVIGKDGKILESEVEAASHPDFVRSVERVMDRWLFEPATLDGKPINIRIRMDVPFMI